MKKIKINEKNFEWISSRMWIQIIKRSQCMPGCVWERETDRNTDPVFIARLHSWRRHSSVVGRHSQGRPLPWPTPPSGAHICYDSLPLNMVETVTTCHQGTGTSVPCLSWQTHSRDYLNSASDWAERPLAKKLRWVLGPETSCRMPGPLVLMHRELVSFIRRFFSSQFPNTAHPQLHHSPWDPK